MKNATCYKFADAEDELDGVFAVWQRVFVVEQGIPGSLVYAGSDYEARHLLAQDDDRVIAAARVKILDVGRAKLERMAVLPAFRNSGIGKEMIEFLVAKLREEKIEKLILHAQQQAIGFYQRCGFSAMGQPFVEAGIVHQEMEMTI